MIIVFGPAGAGKTVQGKLLAAKNKWQWISAGQLLRNDNDPEIIKIVSSGDLVPIEEVNRLITEAFEKADNIDHIVLDGFPRQIEEVDWLLDKSPFRGHSVDAVILIEIDKDEIIKRLSLRARPDDTPKAIEERLEIYSTKMKPILDYFISKGVSVISIDGIGTIEQVHNRITEKLATCNLFKK
ncbi:MAG: nucleoside monophosphate kinase [Candidatus Saccharibacteria bacterium]